MSRAAFLQGPLRPHTRPRPGVDNSNSRLNPKSAQAPQGALTTNRPFSWDFSFAQARRQSPSTQARQKGPAPSLPSSPPPRPQWELAQAKTTAKTEGTPSHLVRGCKKEREKKRRKNEKLTPCSTHGFIVDQDHRAGGPTRVIVEQPKTSNEADDVEKPKT